MFNYIANCFLTTVLYFSTRILYFIHQQSDWNIRSLLHRIADCFNVMSVYPCGYEVCLNYMSIILTYTEISHSYRSLANSCCLNEYFLEVKLFTLLYVCINIVVHLCQRRYYISKSNRRHWLLPQNIDSKLQPLMSAIAVFA